MIQVVVGVLALALLVVVLIQVMVHLGLVWPICFLILIISVYSQMDEEQLSKRELKIMKFLFLMVFLILGLVSIVLGICSKEIIITLFGCSWFVVGIVVLLGIIHIERLVGKALNKFLDYSYINNIEPNFNIEKFNEKAYQLFYDVQMGWIEFDYDKLKKLLSDELYNTYVIQLDELKLKNQKNIMKDFNLISSGITDFKKQNFKYVVKVQLEVEFIDYVEDSETHKVVRGNNDISVDNTYILTFERLIEEGKENTCPNCGSKLEGNVTDICKHCGSKVINDVYDWILTNKEIIDQK